MLHQKVLTSPASTPDKPKPTDCFAADAFGPKGPLRKLVRVLLKTANLGNNLLHSGLLTHGGNAKPLHERTQAVRRWVDGHLHAPLGVRQARYSELAESFVHVLRASNSAGKYDQLVAMLVELMTNNALGAADSDEDD